MGGIALATRIVRLERRLDVEVTRLAYPDAHLSGPALRRAHQRVDHIYAAIKRLRVLHAEAVDAHAQTIASKVAQAFKAAAEAPNIKTRSPLRPRQTIRSHTEAPATDQRLLRMVLDGLESL